MKKVLILYGKSKRKDARPFVKKDVRSSAEHFFERGAEHGYEMYRASYDWYDYEQCQFQEAWTFRPATKSWVKVGPVKPDIIFDKTKASSEAYYKKELISIHYPFINGLTFTWLVDNKFVTSLLFSRWSKKSWLVKGQEQLELILRHIKTDKIVVKPVQDSGGKGVHITTLEECLKLNIKGEHVVQEFIDSSAGIPGIGGSTHDLRLIFVDKEIIYAYTREPQLGSLIANVARGGTTAMVPLEKIPHSVAPIIEHANQVFEAFSPRVFTIDLMFDRNSRPWIVELNSMPGLYFDAAEKPYMEELYARIFKMLDFQMEHSGD